MTKDQIISIIGTDIPTTENEEMTALSLEIVSADFAVTVTIPYGIQELFFRVEDLDGNILLEDFHDFYGDTEENDFADALIELKRNIKKPIFRLVNDGKTLEVKREVWCYWFGKLEF